MKRIKSRIALALRHKIMLVFVLFLGGSLIFVVITSHRHNIIESKLRFVEEADDLRNNVLEARRYEKNLLLYGGEANYLEMIKYISQAEVFLKSLHRKRTEESKSIGLDRSFESLKAYRLSALKLRELGLDLLAGDAEHLSEKLRDHGRLLTEEIDRIVILERQEIDKLVAGQKDSLFFSLLAFTLFAAGVVAYLYLRVFRPLAAIQSAAGQITAGKLDQIPHLFASIEIRSLSDALNMMIRELDRKSEQLLQQEKMAALGTLTSGVAHELNNPLNNISSSTQILLEEAGQCDPEFERNLLQGIERQVEKARDIVKSLLEFAREREFEIAAVNVGEMLENILKLVRGEIPAAVEIKTDIPYPLEMEADYRRLSQALINLILNGLQVMKETGGVLTIGAYYQAKDKSITLEIADTGPGIPEEIMGQIFDPFFTTKDVGQGTGLGLYITYGIIQKHNGQITVHSQPGQGTRFTVKLPLKQPRA
ncbi:MAG: ATP-binding protein [Thermodesulfobacteriota bacterium]